MNQTSDIDIEATLEKFRHWLLEARARGDGSAMRGTELKLSRRTPKHASSGSSISSKSSRRCGTSSSCKPRAAGA